MSHDLLETRRVLWLRALDASPTATARRCAELGTLDWGSRSLCDTCFHSSYGGVTLREQADQEARLIYAADPAPGPAEAFYHLVGVKLPEPVIDALLGVAELRGVVVLKRRTLTWEQVHIHLDAVEGLGNFIEIEAPIGERTTPAQARAQLEEARWALSVRKESQVRETYVELLGNHAPLTPEAL